MRQYTKGQMHNSQQTGLVITQKQAALFITICIFGIAGCILVVALLPTISGDSKLTKENFQRIKAGMTTTQVQTIMGTPDEIYKDKNGFTWVYHKGSELFREADFDIHFESDQVTYTEVGWW